MGGLFAVIYGAAIAGSEWSWGTLKSAVARGESRVRYMMISYVTVAVMIGFGILLTFAVGVVAAIVGAHLANVSTSGLSDSATLGDLPVRLARGWFAVVEEGALGFTIATLARSQLAGIGAGIAFYFGEGFATIFLPDVVKYLPFSVASASLVTGAAAGGGGFGGGGAKRWPRSRRTAPWHSSPSGWWARSLSPRSSRSGPRSTADRSRRSPSARPGRRGRGQLVPQRPGVEGLDVIHHVLLPDVDRVALGEVDAGDRLLARPALGHGRGDGRLPLEQRNAGCRGMPCP